MFDDHVDIGKLSRLVLEAELARGLTKSVLADRLGPAAERDTRHDGQPRTRSPRQVQPQLEHSPSGPPPPLSLDICACQLALLQMLP